MGWRNLEIDHLIIGALIAHRHDVEDDQFNSPAWGPSDAEMPADTDVSGHPRDHDALIRDRTRRLVADVNELSEARRQPHTDRT